MGMIPLRVRRRACVALVVLSGLGLVTVGTAAGADPEDVRACVERNGTRYTDPRPAVDVQYSDFTAGCIAALDDGVSVQFTADPTGNPGGPAPAATGSDGASPSPTPAAGGTATPGERPPATGGGADGTTRPPATAAAAASSADTLAVVRRSSATADPVVDSPLSGVTAVSALPAWLIGAFIVLAGVMAAGAVRAARRRG